MNDEANKPHPSPVVRTELAKVFTKGLIEADLDPEIGTVPSVNVNSSSRDTLSNSTDTSNHARHKKNAIDINRINGQHILQTRSNPAPIATIENLQNSFANQQGIEENFGPVFNTKTNLNGDVKDLSHIDDIRDGHKNHIHISSQACVRIGRNCVEKK